MDIVGDVVLVQPFVALTFAILVLFVGKALNQRFVVLRHFNISESVSGGLAIAILVAALYLVFAIEVQFDVTARQFMLVYFFTAIGINTAWDELWATRRTSGMLLMITMSFMVIQDFIAVSVASGIGGAGPEALLAGTVALVGGPDTVVAWAPTLGEELGVAGVEELGIASATFGLVLGSLAGGPIARHLIRKHRLKSDATAVGPEPTAAGGGQASFDAFVFLRSILAIHVCVIVGLALDQLLDRYRVTLPLPVICFLLAIVLTNLVSIALPRIDWPSRTPAMSLIAELSLGILFGMSLMSAKLWLILDLPTQFLIVILIQLIATALMTTLLVFRLMGKNLDAAVICAGFAGFSLGSTATGMANMKAVAKDSGSLHMAFIVVPMVAVLSVEATNGLMIQLFLSWY